MPSLIDVHCHLDAPVYRDLPTICQNNQAAGVAVTVAAGTGLESNRRILALHQQAPTQVWAALGWHPERLDASSEELEAVLAHLEDHRASLVAVGEIGLPHYALRSRRMSGEQAQRHTAWLHTLLQTAVRLQLPVVLHAPHEAATTALALVQRYEPPGALFHWHKGSPETTRALCAAGYMLSVTPEVCYRERDQQLVQAVPLTRLLLESDGPWAYEGEFQGQQTTSAMIARTAIEVARLKNVSVEEVHAVTTANAERLFRRQVQTSHHL